MPPAIDHEDRAAAAKAAAAKADKARARARRERRRKRQAAAELARETRAAQAAARPSGRVEEDGSFRTPTGKVYDPDTRKLRKVRVPKGSGKQDLKRETSETKAAARPTKRKVSLEDETRATKASARPVVRSGKDRLKAALAAEKSSKRSGFGGIIDAGDVKEVEDAIIGLPAGVVKLTADTAKDVRDVMSPSQITSTGRRRKESKPFERTRANAKAMLEATERDLRHPLRNPLMTGLTAWGLASAGAGTAARVGTAAKVAKAGEGAGATVGVLLKKPVPGERVHTYRGQPVRGRYSSSALSRGLQKSADKARDKKGAPIFGPMPKKGQPKSTISTRKAERLLSEERRVTDAAARSHAIRALAEARDVSDVESMAIRLVAEGVDPDTVASSLRRWAETHEVKRKNRARRGVKAGGHSLQQHMRLDRKRAKELGKKAGLVEAAKRYLDVDANGEPIISAKYPNLQRKYEVTKTAADTRTERLIGAGQLTRQGAIGRVNAPGEMFRQTVGKGKRAFVTKRPRTEKEARARLDYLEGRLEKRIAVGQKALLKDPDENLRLWAETGGDQRSRRVMSESDKAKTHAIGQGDYLEEAPTAQRLDQGGGMKDRAYRRAEEQLYEASHRPNAPDWLKKIGAEMDEFYELRDALNPMFGEDVNAARLGEQTEFHSVAAEPFSAGKFRVPDTLPSKRTPHGPRAYRGGVPRKPATLTNPYTGALRMAGRETTKAVRAVAEDALEAERYLSVERFRQRVLPMASKVRPEDTKYVKHVPVRERPLTKGEARQLRDALKEVENPELTPEEAMRVDEAIKAFEENLFPDVNRYADVQAGATIPGVRWVDSRLLGSQRKLIGRLPVLDVTSDAVKGLILYGKPGYVTPNIIGNVAYNLFQQGALAPANWTRTAKLPDDLAFMVDEVMGHGFARALAEGTQSRISGAVQGAGNFWSKFVDTPFRRAAFIHEARVRGFKTHEQMRDLIENPRHRALMGEIGQRARDAIVDYERMGPYERDLVRRILFVYPWLKGSTYYAGQFLRDHPVQAAVFARLGEVGDDWSQEKLGKLPAWAKGSIPLWQGKGDVQWIANPASASNFATPAQVIAMARGGFGDVERSELLGEATNPILQAAIEAGFKRDLFTGRELEGGYATVFGKQIGKGLPQYRLWQRGGLNPVLPDRLDAPPISENASYPYGPGSALGQFLGGSTAPRPANVPALNEQAAERNPQKRIEGQIKVEKQEVLLGLKQHAPEELNDPQTRQAIESAYGWKQAVEIARRQASLDSGDGEPYRREALRREATLLRERGVIDKDELALFLRYSTKGSIDEVNAARDELSGVFGELYRDPIKELEEAAGVKR